MKQIQLYTGYDSLGFPVEIAQAENGLWYSRAYQFNGWSKSWTPWKRTSTPAPVTRIRAAFYDEVSLAEEYYDVPEGEYIACGFANLRRASPNPRARMPNPDQPKTQKPLAYSVSENKREGLIVFHFDKRPDPDAREIMKKRGFHWDSYLNAWVITASAYATKASREICKLFDQRKGLQQ